MTIYKKHMLFSNKKRLFFAPTKTKAHLKNQQRLKSTRGGKISLKKKLHTFFLRFNSIAVTSPIIFNKTLITLILFGASH